MLPPVFCPWPAPQYWLFSENVPQLVYYAHFLSICGALLAAVFVLLAGRKRLPNQILFLMLTAFVLWVFPSLIFWAANNSDVIMFVWSLCILFEPLVYLGALYLFYTLLKNKDVPFWQKIIFIIPYIPIVIATPTSLALPGFDLSSCLSIEGFVSIYYVYPLELFYAVVLGILAFREYHAAIDSKRKKEILLLTCGIIFLLLAFSWGNIVSSFTENWNFSQIGLFAMPVFMGFLVYSIVRFQTFNIKLLGVQALVVAIILTTGSQFAFIRNSTNRILTAITFVLITFFGWFLIKGVKREIKQKEQISQYAQDLAEAKEKIDKAYQLEKQASAELQRLNEAKSQFLMATQHHLRTPLTAIKGFLSMAMEGDFGKLNDELKEKLNFCFISAERLIKLVNEFLDISKLQLGKEILETKEVSLVDLLEQAVEEVMPEADKKGIYLKLENHWAEPLKIIADPAKLKEALYNLIDNAIKYTEKGGVTVSLRHFADVVPSKIQIVVSDTGIGMTPEEAKDIFGRQFERGTEAKKVYALGRGIGLFLAASIIRAHKGRIWVESPGPGKGSTFLVELAGK